MFKYTIGILFGSVIGVAQIFLLTEAISTTSYFLSWKSSIEVKNLDEVTLLSSRSEFLDIQSIKILENLSVSNLDDARVIFLPEINRILLCNAGRNSQKNGFLFLGNNGYTKIMP